MFKNQAFSARSRKRKARDDADADKHIWRHTTDQASSGGRSFWHLDPPTDNTSTNIQQSSSNIRAAEETAEVPEVVTQQAPKRQTQEAGRLAEFIAVLPRLLSLVLQTEAGADTGELCRCGKGKRVVQCRDCTQYETSCEECFIAYHRYSPFHWAFTWEACASDKDGEKVTSAGYYRRRDIACLRQESYAIQLGHGGGPCPNRHTQRTFTVVHTNGVHGTRIAFCHCYNSPTKVEQLMAARLFPTSLKDPRVALSFQVLDEFQEHHLVSKKTAYDYLGALRRLTDGAFTHAVQEPYKQFLRIARIWRRLCLDKWTGQAYNLSARFPHRVPGSLVLFCPSCPEEGFNMEEGWERTPEKLRHLNQRQWTADGNFHLNQYKKNNDPDDVALTTENGVGYFPSREIMTEYLKIAPKSSEKSTCNYSNIVNNQDSKKFKNLAVTGVVNIQCSHVLIRASVDLLRGEGFAFTDKALQHAFSHIWHNREEGYFGACDDCLSYDCNCQFSRNIGHRFSITCPKLLHIVKRARYSIPALHIQDHKPFCMYVYSSAYMECMGHFHGESAEPPWQESNQLGPAVRQMNSGHRQDVISGYYSYQNWCKIMGMAQRLMLDLVYAMEQYMLKRDIFVSLSVLHAEHLEAWKALDRRPKVVRAGVVQSVYEHTKSKVPSRQAIYRALVAKEDKDDSPEENMSEEGISAVYLVEAMNIQHAQRRVLGKLTLNQTETVKSDIAARRKRLVARIKALRSRQKSLCPAVEQHVVGQAACEPEHEKLFLPSDFTVAERSTKGLSTLGQLEMKLREGELYDSIQSVQMAAKDYSIVYDQKAINDRGVKANTRSQLQLQTIRVELLCCIEDYNTARRALLALGFDCPESLPEMKEKDTFRKSTVRKRGLGDSRRTDGQLFNINLSLPEGMGDQIHPVVHSDDTPVIGTHIIRRKRVRRQKPDNETESERGSHSKLKTPKEDGWIWKSKLIFGARGWSEQEQVDYQIECDRVQWFRALAEKERWQEAFEMKEAEIRRCIRSFRRMKVEWASVANGPAVGTTLEASTSSSTIDGATGQSAIFSSADDNWSTGHRAFAWRQSKIYERLELDCMRLFEELGFDANELAPGEILADRILKRREKMEATEEEAIRNLVQEARVKESKLKDAVGVESTDVEEGTFVNDDDGEDEEPRIIWQAVEGEIQKDEDGDDSDEDGVEGDDDEEVEGEGGVEGDGRMSIVEGKNNGSAEVDVEVTVVSSERRGSGNEMDVDAQVGAGQEVVNEAAVVVEDTEGADMRQSRRRGRARGRGTPGRRGRGRRK